MLLLPTGVLTALCVADPPAPATAPATDAPTPNSARVPIPGTALAVELVEVPALVDGATLWVGRTEIPWEVLDVFVHGLDEGESTPEADAVTRPSKPYISMDRGFGHHGFPAISVSHRNATEFCRWLRAKTGAAFRLPTRAEWSALCARSAISAEARPAHAWLAENSERRTHEVGSRKADAAGLHDLLGNACEWATDGESFVVMGGSYRDSAASLSCDFAVPANKEWNASDPQIPRGEWWLADGGFVGFRVVCESVPTQTQRRSPQQSTKESSGDSKKRTENGAEKESKP